MLKAIASLHSYRHWTLDHSFYVMVLVAAAVTSRSSLEAWFWIVSRNRRDEQDCTGPIAGTCSHLLANERWVWITPVVLVAVAVS